MLNILTATYLFIHFSYIFWTEWLRTSRYTARIGRAFGDGTNATYIRQHELGWPNGLALDTPNKRVYWCDALFDRIQSSDLDGQDVQNVGSSRIAHPFGLTVYGGKFVKDILFHPNIVGKFCYCQKPK